MQSTEMNDLNYMQMRYDEERGIYQDCKWCKGRGCLACPGEAEKEYKRQFPNGPVPIATIPLDKPLDLSTEEGISKLTSIINDTLPKLT
jgi:hypothetical protein